MIKNHIYLSLGTNLGDRYVNLRMAQVALPPAVTVIAQSTIYETPPWGYLDQPAFLNQMLEAETELKPGQLLKYLKEIERQVGRTPTFQYGPRLIDVDILLYNELIFNSPRLTIPHPFLHLRGFVLVPMAEIAPNIIHPVLGKTIYELMQTVDTRDIRPYHPNQGNLT